MWRLSAQTLLFCNACLLLALALRVPHRDLDFTLDGSHILHETRDDVLVKTIIVPSAEGGQGLEALRRRNDRMQTLSQLQDNIPTVYVRLLNAMGIDGGSDAAAYTAAPFPVRRRTGVSDNAVISDSEEFSTTVELEKQSTVRKRIAKFLNLFTVVQFSNEACEAPGPGGGVGLTGTCLHHLQCRSLGGKPRGSCAQGYGVCCVFEKTCGEITQFNSTYFVSPPSDSKPAIYSARADGYYNCFLTVVKIHPDVSQLRLDFQHFELAAPSNGSCADERFVVISPDRNAPVPALCGENTGQHMYVQVSSAPGRVRLGVQWLGGPAGGGRPRLPRRWVVRVTQLRAQDQRAAPPGCLQLHTSHSGQLRSFGFQGPHPGYTNNLNYAICVRKEIGFCSITYSAQDSSGSDVPFQLLNADQDGSPTIPPGQAGAEIFNCPDDYIVVNGVRLCGERLNDASVDADYTHNTPVTDNGSGPFVLPVRTNGRLTGRGFELSYRQNPCAAAKESV